MKINAINVRSGNVLEIEGKLLVVIKIEIIQPGKGNAIVQVDMRDARTGVKTNMRFRTQESVERVRVDEKDFQFLYAETDGSLTFMDLENFEQMTIQRDVVGEQADFLQESMQVSMEIYEGRPLAVTLPTSVVMEIKEADPVVKGQTASSSYKPAILENGARIMVPPHIEAGTKVVVNIAERAYVERFKG